MELKVYYVIDQGAWDIQKKLAPDQKSTGFRRAVGLTGKCSRGFCPVERNRSSPADTQEIVIYHERRWF